MTYQTHLARYLADRQRPEAAAGRLVADLVDTAAALDQLEADAGLEYLQQLLDALIRHGEAMFDAAIEVASTDDLTADTVVARRYRSWLSLPPSLALLCIEHDEIADSLSGWCPGCRAEIMFERANDQ